MKDYFDLPIKAVFAALEKTEVGQSLQQMIRYGKFRDSSETPAFWREVLGPSANSLEHSKLMVDVTYDFVMREATTANSLFDAIQARSIVITALCHDFGEAKIDADSVGDVVYDVLMNMSEDERKKHEEQEVRVFYAVLSTLSSIVDEVLQKEFIDAYIHIARNKYSKLGDFFNAVERTEYVMTAVHVYTAELQNKKLKYGIALIGNVLKNQIPYLVDNSKKYQQSVGRYCEQNKLLIQDMLDYIKDYYVNHSSDEERTQFNRAYNLWINHK